MIPNIQLTPGFNNISVVKVNQPVFGRKCITSVKCLNCLDFICMRMLTRCLKDASSQPPRRVWDIGLCPKTWSQWQHLWVKGPQLMTMYWNLKTLLGCYHANDGHNWRLLPEVKWEERVVPEINHDSGSHSGKELSLAGGFANHPNIKMDMGFPTVSEMNEQSVSSA